MEEMIEGGSVMSWIVPMISAVVGGFTAIAGQFMFRKQEKESRDLDNEAKRAERERERADEWRKLYIESKEDSDRKESVIQDYMQKEHDHMITEARLEARVAALECQRCEVYECVKRRPPLKEQYAQSDAKYNEETNDTEL